MAEAQSMLMDLARSDSRVLLDPAPTTFVDSVSNDGATVTLRYWARSDNWFATTRDMTKSLKNAFDERDVRLSEQAAE
jgi:small conductance mechanosensitive channel